MKSDGGERKQEKERHATWLELFYDLVFVAVVSQLADNLDHDISLTGLLSFIALFIPVFFAWLGTTFFATRFGTDDLSVQNNDIITNDGSGGYGCECFPGTW